MDPKRIEPKQKRKYTRRAKPEGAVKSGPDPLAVKQAEPAPTLFSRPLTFSIDGLNYEVLAEIIVRKLITNGRWKQVIFDFNTER